MPLRAATFPGARGCPVWPGVPHAPEGVLLVTEEPSSPAQNAFRAGFVASAARRWRDARFELSHSPLKEARPPPLAAGRGVRDRQPPSCPTKAGVSLGLLAITGSTNVTQEGALRVMCSSQGLETEVDHVGGQPGLCDRAPLKTSDTETRVSFPGGLATHCHQESKVS